MFPIKREKISKNDRKVSDMAVAAGKKLQTIIPNEKDSEWEFFVVVGRKGVFHATGTIPTDKLDKALEQVYGRIHSPRGILADA